MKKQCELIVSDIRLWVHLGCSLEEKHQPQCVSITLKITFPTPPTAIHSDNLADTFCYLNAVEILEASLKNRQFNLVEHLTGHIYEILVPKLKNNALTVILTKVSPPVPSVHGGVSFSYDGPHHEN